MEIRVRPIALRWGRKAVRCEFGFPADEIFVVPVRNGACDRRRLFGVEAD
jgi:hypothetical protein